MHSGWAYWKVALAVWSPLLIGAAIYGSVYAIRYAQATREYKKELAAYTSCMGDYDSKLAEYNSTATKQVVNGWTYTWHTEAQPKMNCYATGDVRHGFLWLPEYGVN